MQLLNRKPIRMLIQLLAEVLIRMLIKCSPICPSKYSVKSEDRYPTLLYDKDATQPAAQSDAGTSAHAGSEQKIRQLPMQVYGQVSAQMLKRMAAQDLCSEPGQNFGRMPSCRPRRPFGPEHAVRAL